MTSKINTNGIDKLSSAELREWYLNVYFKPVAQKLFELEPKAKMCCLAFAQYYCDESIDAVHHKLILSSEENLSFEDLFNKNYNLFASDSASASYRTSKRLAIEFVTGGNYSFYLNNHISFIAAFEPYCKEGCHEDMYDVESYQPYAYAYPDKNGTVRISIIGDIIRVFK